MLQFIETFFRRYFWIANITLIFIIALLTAIGINHIISAYVLAPFTAIRPRSSEELPPLAVSQQSNDILELFGESRDDDGALAERNICLSDRDCNEGQVCRDGDCITPEPEPEAEEEFVFHGDCIESEIGAALVGTVVAQHSQWSHGLVQDLTSNQTRLVRVGDSLAGAQVIRITNGRLFVDNQGVEECLKAGHEPATNRPRDSRQRVVPASAPRPPGPVDPNLVRGNRPDVSVNRPYEVADGIRQMTPSSYEITREAVDNALSNPRLLQAHAPEFEQSFDDGRRPNGILLTSLPAGSLFSNLGIRANDVITAVNGQPLTTTQRALDLYEALQNDRNVEITVMRRGRPRSFQYEIR